MNRKGILILTGLVLFFTGCTDFVMICSLNPFYVEKNVTLLPELEGSWSVTPMQHKAVSGKKKQNAVWNRVDTTSVWKIERKIARETKKDSQGKDSIVLKPMNYYHVLLVETNPDTTIYRFKMVIFKVKGILYADFMPIDNTGLEKSRFAAESYFRIHTLARVVIRNQHPEFSWLGAEYTKEMIEKKRVRVSYRWISDAGRLLLTGSPEQLTDVIDRYAGEPRFIDWDNQAAQLKLNRLN